MQPLDVGIYSPFKCYYNSAMESWMLRNPGKPITIYDLAEIIGIAFNKAMTPSNIINAFKKTGIYPFDKDIFSEEDFLPSQVTDRPNPSDSVYSYQSDRDASKDTTLQDVTNDISINQSIGTNQSNSTSLKNDMFNTSIEPQPGHSKESSSVSTDFISPMQFRDPIKAAPRKNTRKNKKPRRSLIATDTPEMENIRLERLEAKKRKMPKEKKKTVEKKVLQSDSDTDNTNISLHDEDSEWCEDEEDIPTLKYDQLLQTPLLCKPQEGDYVLVHFATKQKSIYYVGKILHNRNENLEYNVSFLRKNHRNHFSMPNIPDLSYVREDDIKYVLPKPGFGGSTSRQQSYYYFNVDFSEINIP